MPRPRPPKPITPRLIERHETLFPKLQALARRVEAQAARRPQGAVSDALRAEAEALLFEAETLVEFRAHAALPVAAPHLGGLAGQLRAALADLLAFEARHSHWDARANASVWALARGSRTVKRLMPRPGSRAAAQAAARAEKEAQTQAAKMADLRAKLVKRLTQFRMRETIPPEAAEPPAPAQAAAPDKSGSHRPPGPTIRFL